MSEDWNQAYLDRRCTVNVANYIRGMKDPEATRYFAFLVWDDFPNQSRTGLDFADLDAEFGFLEYKLRRRADIGAGLFDFCPGYKGTRS